MKASDRERPRSSDRADSVDAYVFPGQIAATPRGRQLTTVLGSCISVCLFDARVRVGGMNHFLLPFPVGGAVTSPRFAGPAVSQLIERLLALGARQERLVAKVYGGCVPPGAGASSFHVGVRNVEAARQLLAAAGIPILHEDVGGTAGRRLVFDTEDGSTRVRKVGETG